MLHLVLYSCDMDRIIRCLLQCWVPLGYRWGRGHVTRFSRPWTEWWLAPHLLLPLGHPFPWLLTRPLP